MLPLTLTLERFAELRAEMQAGSARDSVLRREGLSPEAWTNAEKEWLKKMGREAARGRFMLMNRYVAATRAHRPEVLDESLGGGAGRALLAAGQDSPPIALVQSASYAAALSVFAQEFELEFGEPGAPWAAHVRKTAERAKEVQDRVEPEVRASERLYVRYCIYWRGLTRRTIG
jgi:hypothetical protein